ncbi:DUF6685 family protein [Delftia acidovorans]|uniref:DUF6685 family protein n=1 Tax=Delftia acidovorans TaxID=80866 RepID=UPI0028E71552|nr:DUF6685 family protein [Delftia acidovorans]
MKALLKQVVAGICEDFGNPVRLRRMLAEYPQIRVVLAEPLPSIAASSVPPWHELGKHPLLGDPRRSRGTLSGWRYSSGVWQSFERFYPEYDQIAHCEIEHDWGCDLSDIDGFSASKADLQTYLNTDAMAEARCQWLISEITEERLGTSLAHQEIRIIHAPGTLDHFARYLWDGRLWLMNHGGSHHVAAAKYLSARLGKRVPLVGTRRTYSLNPAAISSLLSTFEMFAISNKDSTGYNAFFKAMEAFRATWLSHPLPAPYDSARAILLPRSELRSMRVAAELRNAGIANLGTYLSALCERQQRV